MLSFYMAVIDDLNDREKFEMLYNTYKKKMWYAASKILSDGFLAEDAVHDAFVGIAKNMKKIGDVDSLKTYAYVITAAKNSAISILRKNSGPDIIDIDELYDLRDSASEVAFEASETEDTVKRILMEIPETYRDVLYYFLVEEMSEKEIAALLSRNINTVRQQVRRGRLLVAQRLKKGAMNDGSI